MMERENEPKCLSQKGRKGFIESPAIIIEVLVQKTQRSGPLAASLSVNDIPDLARITALYLPTVIAVIYGFFFACVDLDVKRMQPWIELSRPEGATVENSLLLGYDFDFLAFVPFRAARQRHWPVFCSGTVMVVIFWSITPLRSSIFGTGSVVLTQPAILSYPDFLVPVQEQAASMDASVLNGAFAATWLNQTFPASTTADSAALPIRAIHILQDTTEAS
ncbi:hypothetical protein SCARD494_02390 [Seiridium cardinale]